MKFKLFRRKESSNSVKVLLKKLKRHDTKVVAVAVIIALFLSGGLIYISTPIVATNATEGIAQSERQSNKETTEKLNQINTYLTELDKVVTNNQKSLNTITQNSSFSSSKETIDATGKTTNTISEKVTTLDGSLKDVHSTIESTTSKIEELNKALEKSGTDNKKQLEEDFAQVNQDLSKIYTEYDEARKQNKELIEKLQKEMADSDKKLNDSSSDNHKALLKELETMGKNMDEKNTQTISSFQSDITKFSESMDKKLANINTSVNDQFENINNSVNNNFNTMNNTVNAGMGELKEYVGNVAGGINGRLDQVFQSVSDGKKLLASTLLTKGITIKEDATFEEISKAIMDIPTTITVQEMTGTVVYDKHFHTDGNGTVCDEHHVPLDRKGGCYDKPYYHVHDSSCYKTRINYTYYTQDDTYQKFFIKNENGYDFYEYGCRHCGSSFMSTNGGHLEYASTREQAERRNGQGIERHVNKVLVCGKNAKTLEGYSCSCGYLYGQILAAHIDYSMNKDMKSLPEIEQSHMAVQSQPNSSALDALLQLTEYDMNVDNSVPIKEKELTDKTAPAVSEKEMAGAIDKTSESSQNGKDLSDKEAVDANTEIEKKEQEEISENNPENTDPETPNTEDKPSVQESEDASGIDSSLEEGDPVSHN